MAHESPQAHIVRIRRDKFLLDGNGLPVTKNPLADDLQNSVNHLSEGLYSKDIHFILELIQNAEDNEYLPGQRPELAFHLLVEDPTGTGATSGALLISNNENGLRAKDVDALCAVGVSTKTKRQGYIGEKGIGFKSVFRVSRCPHIFSAGYRFRFDRQPDGEAGLGYIVPYWVDSIPREMAAQEIGTHILLPLDANQWEPVARQLRAIAPETILFLNRLEGLSLVIPGAPPLDLVADKQRKPRVYLMNGDDLATYWVHQIEVTRPFDLNEEKRLGVNTRDVSVAFPLAGEQKPTYSVFAFLPTEVQSGYPFLVNADFVLSTSREMILVDRPWNQWLRDQITPCFVEGFGTLLSEIEYRQQAYQFIPLEDEVIDSFFIAPAKAIHQHLQALPVIWTVAGDELVLPETARLAPSSFRKLLEQDRPLPQQLALTPLVRPELEHHRRRLRAIGVKPLQPKEVRSCLEDREWLARRSTEWFGKLYEYFQQDDWAAHPPSERNTRSLEGLPIIPATDGKLAKVGEFKVFLPETAAETLVWEHATRLDGLGKAIFLHTDLYHLLTTKPELLDWVKREIAEPWSRERYCRGLVQALSDKAAKIPVIQTVETTKIIRDLVSVMNREGANKLCDGLPLLLANGTFEVVRQRPPHNLVSPTNLDPDTGWQEVFSSLADREGLHIISDCYLEGCADPQERRRWADFFETIGVVDNPVPIQSWTLDRYWRKFEPSQRYWYPSNMPDDLRQQVVKLDDSTRGYTVTDIRVPRWLEHPKLDEEIAPIRLTQARAMLKWLHQGRYYDVHNSTKLEWFYFKPESKPLNSHFRAVLQTASWVSSTKGFRRPGEIFLDRPEVREIFGDAVPYATESIEPHVAEWLDMRMSVTVQDVLGYLSTLADRPAEKVERNLVEQIYAFLLERWRDGAIETEKAPQSLFTEKAFIRVERPSPRWVLAADAIWLDRSDVFGDSFAYLERSFPSRLKEFFVDHCLVKEDADEQLYARAWLRCQQEEKPDPKQVEATLERVFPMIRRVTENPDLQVTWWDEFRAQAQVWTQDDRFLLPTQVFVPDDGLLKKVMEAEGVPFAWRPSKDGFGDYKALYAILGVRGLAESITCYLGAEVHINDVTEEEQCYLTRVAKRGICFYLWNQAREDYARLREDGTLALLLAAQEARVDRLELVYTLDHFEVVDGNAVAYIAGNTRKLFLSDAAETEERDVEVSALLARLLSKGRTNRPLNDFISSILSKTEKHLQYLCEKNDWRLPKEEREWVERAVAGQIESPATRREESADSIHSPLMQSKPEDREFHDFPQEAVPLGPGEEEPAETSKGTGMPGVPVTEPGWPSTFEEQDESARQDRDHGPLPAGDTAPTVPTIPGMRTGRRSDDDHNQTRPGRQPSTERHAGISPNREPQEHRPFYVEPEEMGDRHARRTDREKTEFIEKAGIKAVETYEWAHGRKPVVLEDYHPGWDIDSFGQPILPDAQPDRRIEVKSKEGAWDEWGVALTPKQYESAIRYPETYYLYVVEHALDDECRQIHVFRNPAAKVTEFRFRQNWRVYADESYPQEISTR